MGIINPGGGSGGGGGTVTQVNTTGALTGGPITSTGTLDVVANGIDNARLAQMAAHTYKGNNTGGTANALDLTATQLTAELNNFTTILKGLVPPPGSVTGAVLSDSGAWVPQSGGSGITTLIGDVSAGPGSGSQLATLATVNSNVGSFTSANITVNAKGLITAASNGTGGGGAPTNASYVVMGNDATLTDERVLAATSPLQLSDSGAGNFATLGVTANAISNSFLSTMAASTIKGSVAGGTPDDLTATQATGILSPFVASGASHAKGLVPDPGTTARSSKFLREDASFQVPSGLPKIYQSGKWSFPQGGSGTPASFAANTIWFIPILIYGDAEAVSIGAHVTSGSSANSAAAIFSAFDTRPNTLLQQSPNTAVASGNPMTWTLNAAALLHDMPGAFLCFWCDTAITISINGSSNSFSLLPATTANFGDLTTNGNFTGWTQSLAYTGTFPSTPGTLTKQTGSVPQLAFQQQ